jgi:signal transduction histidine kinase
MHGVIVLLHDITRRKKLDQAKDEFLSIASHELRTPLTAIRGNTELLRSYFKNRIQDADFADIVEDIHFSAKRLIEIVTTFLQTSRLEQGKIQFSIEKLAVNQILSDIVKRFKPFAEQKNIFITAREVDGDLFIRADRIRVDEVLTNLVGNAIAMTNSGLITVTAARHDNAITISVTDTGRGISPEQQGLLFKKFQQINDNLYSREYMHNPYSRDTSQGTGLGLYISRLLVEAMGGTIYLEKSEVGKGSVFSFTLPSFEEV